MALRWGPSSQLFAATLVAALLGQAAAVAPSAGNCPASYLAYYPSATCCPAGYALTQLSGSACQVFTCAAGNNATQCRVLGNWYYATLGAQWTSPGSSFTFDGYASLSCCPATTYTTANFAAWAAAASGVATDYATLAEVKVDTNGDVVGMYWNPNHNGHLVLPAGATLPPSLGLLTSLVYIDISGAAFAGSIPASYSALTSLKWFSPKRIPVAQPRDERHHPGGAVPAPGVG